MLPTIVTVNPFMAKKHHRAKHKRAHGKHRYRARHARSTNAFHRRRHRRSRSVNPFKVFSGRGAMHDVTGALIGAGGAVLTDVAMAYAAPYLPASLQSGWLNLLARAAAAVGVGYIAGKVTSRDTGKAVTAGGLIVVAYSGLKQALAPTLGTSIKGLSGLADFGDYVPYSGESAAMAGGGMGAYMQPRLGAYMRHGMGAYMNPAAFIGAGNAGASPIVARQRVGVKGFGSFGYTGGDYQSDDGAMM